LSHTSRGFSTLLHHITIPCAMSFYCEYPLFQEDNIRLLSILPNENRAAALQCNLRCYSLQSPNSRTHLYEALSYVWGDDESNRQTVEINGNQFPVRRNLHAALLNLRDNTFERNIWIDAICIDQKNVKERNHQVPLMAKIYSKANRVIIWLGDETDDTKGALEDICLAANESSNHETEKINQQAILNLLRRPWFERIWV
jgi:hypothetical protein